MRAGGWRAAWRRAGGRGLLGGERLLVVLLVVADRVVELDEAAVHRADRGAHGDRPGEHVHDLAGDGHLDRGAPDLAINAYSPQPIPKPNADFRIATQVVAFLSRSSDQNDRPAIRPTIAPIAPYVNHGLAESRRVERESAP